MPHATRDGRRIHYRTFGAGAPLVVHHGFGASLNRWIHAGYIEPLSREFHVIAIDALGHGESDKPHDPAAYLIEEQAADVVAVLDDLGIAKAAYWGYSMGGRVAFALAKIAPQRLQALVIGGAHPHARTLPPGDRLDGSDPQAFVDSLYKRLGTDLNALPAAMREELYANDFRALAAVQQDWPSLDDVLPRIAVPTLLYVGEKDVYVDRIRRYRPRIANAEMFTIPDADHGMTFWKRDEILPQVTRFVRRAWGRVEA